MTDAPVVSGTLRHEELLREVGVVLRSVDELQDYLAQVVDVVRERIDGCDEVGVTLLIDERPNTAAYTTVETLEIDAVQYQLDQGPCLEAARTRSEVRASLDDSAAQRWPLFAEAVRRDGVLSLMALPLVSGDECVGALNLYGNEPHAFDDFEASLARMAAGRMADAIVGVLHLDGAQRLAGQLEQAMASRAIIEQAKGALMAMRGIDEHAAFAWLRQASQDRNIKLSVLAAAVIAGVTSDASSGGATDAARGSH